MRTNWAINQAQDQVLLISDGEGESDKSGVKRKAREIMKEITKMKYILVISAQWDGSSPNSGEWQEGLSEISTLPVGERTPEAGWEIWRDLPS